jgi:hypothetical protein
MKGQLYRRLSELERISGSCAQTRIPDSGPTGVDLIRMYLTDQKIEQGSRESLAETFARSQGITCQELHERMITGALI